MKTVGVRELKNRLSEYLRRLRAGESVLVTDRGEVVAEFSPPRHGQADESVPAGLRALARRGIATVGAASDAALYKHCRANGEASARLPNFSTRNAAPGESVRRVQRHPARVVRESLATAELVVASDLTLIECDRCTGDRGSRSATISRRANLHARCHSSGLGHNGPNGYIRAPAALPGRPNPQGGEETGTGAPSGVNARARKPTSRDDSPLKHP